MIDFLVYDGDPSNGIAPYRPSANDLGGCQKLDDANFPADPVTMPSAWEYNEMGLLLVALAKVTGAALIYVSNSGTPTISGLRAAGSIITASPVVTVGSVSTCGDFTVTHNGAGDFSVVCSATKLMAPFACLAFPQVAGDFRASGRLNGTGNGVRVETRSGSTLTDCDTIVFWL